MPHPRLASDPDNPRPIWLATEESWPSIAQGLPPRARVFAAAQSFEGKAGTHCVLPDAEGGILGVAFRLASPAARRADPFRPGKLPTVLPEGD